MTSIKDTLRQRLQARIPGWHGRWLTARTAGAATLYGFLATMTVCPMIVALIAGEATGASTVFAALSVAGGLGSNLLARLVDSWAKGGDEAKAAEELPRRAAEHAEICEVLNHLMEEIHNARRTSCSITV